MERREVAAEEAPPRQQLPPGFRFHPTDEELVLQYLRRKALSRPLPAAVIPVVDAAALPDPWGLPGASEGEAAYFFSQRHAPARAVRGRRRRADSGYWKATGKEKPVSVQLQGPSGSVKRILVGVKTALAFHRGKGKAPESRTASPPRPKPAWPVSRRAANGSCAGSLWRAEQGDHQPRMPAARPARRPRPCTGKMMLAITTSRHRRRRAASRTPVTLRITKKKSEASGSQ